MPNRYSWNKLAQPVNCIGLTPRSGHSLTPTSAGYVCFGGVDGRKNESAVPVPNNDLYVLTVRGQEYSWTMKTPVSQAPPARALHSATRLDDHRIFVFGGLHSSSPYKALNDAWILDISCVQWINVAAPAEGDANRGVTVANTPPVRKSINKSNGTPLAVVNGRRHSAVASKQSFQERVIDMVSSMASDEAFPGVMTRADAPAPRSGHTCCLISSSETVVLFGGCGGFGFSRKHMSDVHAFSLSEQKWSQIECRGNPPLARSGHGAASTDDKMYVFGGWNSETQFSDLFVLDVKNKDWSDLDLSWSSPRWNACMTLVKGLPNSKIFVFGGCVEGEGRSCGIFDNQIGVLDLVAEKSAMSWDQPVVEEASLQERSFMAAEAAKLTVPPLNAYVPCARESACMVYDEMESRLIVFGGWSNKWLSDVWTIDVSAIIGPPYAVYGLSPSMGPVTGGKKVKITGQGFSGLGNKICVRFSVANGVKSDVFSAYVIDDHCVECTTPNVESTLGAQNACEVRLAIGSKDFTTTYAGYQFYLNTSASKSLCYGPGLLEDGEMNAKTVFVIQARNETGQNRTSGQDCFSVEIFESEVDISHTLSLNIEDKDDGRYLVSYLVPAGADKRKLQVRVNLLDEKTGLHAPVRGSPFGASFIVGSKPRANEMTGPLVTSFIVKGLKEMEEIHRKTDQELVKKLKLSDDGKTDIKALISVMDGINELYAKESFIELRKDSIGEQLGCLERAGVSSEKAVKQLRKIVEQLDMCREACRNKEIEFGPTVATEKDRYKNLINVFERETLKRFSDTVKSGVFYMHKSGVEKSVSAIKVAQHQMATFVQDLAELEFVANAFGYPDVISGAQRAIDQISDELGAVAHVWALVKARSELCDAQMVLPLSAIQADSVEEEVKRFLKELRDVKVDKKSDCFVTEMEIVKKWLLFVPLLAELKDPNLRPRHWGTLSHHLLETGQDSSLSLQSSVALFFEKTLFKFGDLVGEVTDQAKQEGKMERTLQKLEQVWGKTEFVQTKHRETSVLLKLKEDDFEQLEDHQVQVQNMCASRFLTTFETQIYYWQKALANVNEVSVLLGDVQKSWSFLENLFVYSEEVKKELPEDTDRFAKVDADVRAILSLGCSSHTVCLSFCNMEGILDRLERCLAQLAVCEKSLNDFMDGKRRAFPRFYFVSTLDLLDILSNGNTPAKVMVHLSKVFQCVSTYRLEYSSEGARPHAVGLESCVGVEYVPFPAPLPLLGKVEIYMDSCVEGFRNALKFYAQRSLCTYHQAGDVGRGQWIVDAVVAQCVLLTNMVSWVERVEESFEKVKLENKAMEIARDRSAHFLLDLIRLTTRADLSKQTRQKVMCMITLDAHNRDIQDKLVQEKVTSADAFQWQAQLKAYWDEASRTATIRIADAVFEYGYEYLGNGSRLVITPLTDRIYVTCTQALHLGMGCAPAGPAGTGKTESTKDLANALGKPCFVFNASPEMDYKTMGNIFKGLASSGSWGCFDEFNRLIPEVLSVCSVQFKAVCDAIKTKAPRFLLQGDEISIQPGTGVFITMNPGYIGRSSLPSSLSSLFRPVTVMVADFFLIISNCLMSEGFLESDKLAKKFSTLYALCGDLLSKSKQYDWGMRAIKSVLVVAGAFKRADPSLSEEAVLMRALRDTNIAKIDGDDFKIFLGLLNDLFPGVDVPRARNESFEKVLIETIEEMGYANDSDGYLLLKITQLVELLSIRHCIFMMGPAGSFKSAVWKILAKAKEKIGDKTTWVDLNPKSISTQELYGYVNMATREWKDGILSKTMRSLAQIPDTLPKWIVLDGDLDANWIESMNSVMDDNKLLTLPSNERIALKPNMRMIFEIRDLNFATPATVTRAGVVNLVDYAGVQWRSFKNAWIKKWTVEITVKETVNKLMDKHCGDVLAFLNKNCKIQVPMVDISIVQSLCALLESVMSEKIAKSRAGASEDVLVETIFTFCLVWAAGGCLGEQDGVDYRKQFSSWWRSDVKSMIKFPSKGSIFDYFVSDNGRFEEWASILPRLDYSSEIPMNTVTVPTSETISTAFIVKALIKVHHPVMLIGPSGCGKTQQCKGILKDLDPALFSSTSINMNYYTDSASLQAMLEAPLEKKAGKLYGPPGRVHLIYFIDDLNMQQLDPYNTQSAISLLRQAQDYKHWYDRQKISIREIANTQLLCAMNPSAGSFVVDQRLQRHFWTCAVSFPEQASLSAIYSTFMRGHFERLNFKPSVVESVGQIVKAGLALHGAVTKGFRKSALNFHYESNIRHLSGVFGGLLQMKPQDLTDPEKAVALWLHESERVYGDRLVSMTDVKKFRANLLDVAKRSFKLSNPTKMLEESCVFAPFAKGMDEPSYDRINSIERLTELVQEALKEYNDSNPAMDLVLFEDAVKHVARIARIISNPSSGHALLVGVGGSGRQSLARLAGYICRANVMGVVISSSYGLSDFRNDLQAMYHRAGVKDEKVLFLLTDGQITNERFLVYINDLLSCGEIADLYTNEEKDAIRNAVRPACKADNIPDSPENVWKYFIARVKRNLHMCLCFSPVGEVMRNRARKFPALINCTVIDWFHPWPKEALKSVACKFLAPIECLGEADSPIRKAISDFMPFSFECVSQLSQEYMQQERRFAYTTPKSFLELIKLYTSMVGSKLEALEEKQSRLSSGLEKLKATQASVADLELALKETAIVVEQKAKSADLFAQQVGKEKEVVNAEVEKAAIEKAKCEEIAKNVAIQQKSCEEDLAVAIPLVRKAEAALDVLNKKDFQELKSFAKPPPGVDKVCEACLYLLAGIDPSIEVDKKGKVKEASWKGSQKMMSNPEKFLESLKSFKAIIDAGSVSNQNIDNARPLTQEPDFTVESMTKKSRAAAGLCEWVLNIVMYFDVVASVDPKRRALKQASDTLASANERLAAVEALVAQLQAKLEKLISEFDSAMADKKVALEDAEKCTNKLDLAQRLINALGANGGIWESTIASLGQEQKLIPGDVVIACSFVSYLSIFSREYREKALKEFVNFLSSRGVPLTPDFDPLLVLTSEAEMARWQTQGLPSDRVSCENGAIIANSQRWCLLVDPQLQGITWLKNKQADLRSTRMGHAKMVSVFEAAIEQGKVVLVENVNEQIDAVLAPVIGRNTIKRGRSRVLKLGDKEINYHNDFKLFLHTTLSNPHFPPELHAECTIINFTVTEQGLEEQLLFLVVKLERPDLAKQKADLILSQNEFKVKLADLEILLLEKLANSQGDILQDSELILSLEEAKRTSEDVKAKAAVAKETEARINKTSEYYRPCANRGSLLFFYLTDLRKIHSFYKYSLEAFVGVVTRGILSLASRRPASSRKSSVSGTGLVPPGSVRKFKDGSESVSVSGETSYLEEESVSADLSVRDLEMRVDMLMKTITKCVFFIASRGLFESHKLTAAAMLCFRIIVRSGLVSVAEIDLLIKAPLHPSPPAMSDPLKSWVSETVWAQLKQIETVVPALRTVTASVEQDGLSWKRWLGEEKLESADLPRQLRDVSPFYKLLLVRVFRPDRVSSAVSNFVVSKLGPEFIEKNVFDIDRAYSESSSTSPLFFVLFPGADPTVQVEALARRMNVQKKFVNISMGQGQEQVAINALTSAAKEGGWVMLQNVHLMQSWLKMLERTLESIESGAHIDFRCIITSEPPPPSMPLMDLVPESILQKSVKIADEAPEDIKSNLRRAWSRFSQTSIDQASLGKQKEFKACLFGLCFFHALMLGRKRFGPQGWSRVYPFNDGDLTICASVLANYLSKHEKAVPWPDIRYIFGEIMYGGHVTDPWDRRVSNTYLSVLIVPELLANLSLAPNFKSPDPSKMDFSTYSKFIEDRLPGETPQMFALHPNAEIRFLTNQGNLLMDTVQSVQGGGGSSSISGSDPIAQLQALISAYLSQLPKNFDLSAIRAKITNWDPYIIVALQECERINALVWQVRRSLIELEMGLSGALNVSDQMEDLIIALRLNRVFSMWEKLAFHSLKPLSAWLADLSLRAAQLAEWTANLKAPKSVWLSGLFNPMSYLTAVMQVTARQRDLPLDSMTNRCVFTNIKDPKLELTETSPPPPNGGVYVHGLFIEGASWEEGKGVEEGYITDSKPKVLHPQMPVLNVFAVPNSEMDWENMYRCPVFTTSARGPTYVFTANVRMEPDDKESRWILAGAALLLTDD